MPGQNTLLILKRFSSAYPEKLVSKATMQVYLEELGDIPIPLLDRAVSQLIRTSPWFPRISDVRRVAFQIAGATSFASLPQPGVDSLALEAMLLENRYFQEGEFDFQAWERLASQFQCLGCHYQAGDIRRNESHIRANELALQRGEEYPPRRERMRYSAWEVNSSIPKE